MTLNVLDPAPDFHAESTVGPLDFHQWKGDSWAIMIANPFAHTPCCTTELGGLLTRRQEFVVRNVKRLALSIDTVDSLREWASDIAGVYGETFDVPIVADVDRKVADLYGMMPPGPRLPIRPGRWLLPNSDTSVRATYLISPDNEVALVMNYPPNVAVHFGELLTLIDALQT